MPSYKLSVYFFSLIFLLTFSSNSKLNDNVKNRKDVHHRPGFTEKCNLTAFDDLEDVKLIEIIASLTVLCDDNVILEFLNSAVSVLRERERIEEELKIIAAQLAKEAEEKKAALLLAEREKAERVDGDNASSSQDEKSSKKSKKSKKSPKQRKSDKESEKSSEPKERKGKGKKREGKGKKEGKASKKGQRGKGKDKDETILRKKFKVSQAPQEETIDWMMGLPFWANSLILSSAITNKKDADTLSKVNEYWKYLTTCEESEKEARNVINTAIKNLQIRDGKMTYGNFSYRLNGKEKRICLIQQWKAQASSQSRVSWRCYFTYEGMLTSVVIALLVGVIILILWHLTSKPKEYPPGPIKWPVVGNIFQMKTDGYTHRTMSKWHKKYGEIVGFFAGNSPVVLISGFRAIQEGLTREDLSGRQGNKVLRIMNDGQRLGIVNTDGEVWMEQRQFTYSRLREPVIGKFTVESIVHEEIKAVLNDIDYISGGRKKGYSRPVCFHDILGGTAINILWHIVSGKRYSHDDPGFKYLTTIVNKFFQANEPSGVLLIIFPGLARLFPSLARTKELRETCEPLFQFVEDMISEHKKAIDHNNLRDFTDIYLREIEKRKGDTKSSFTEKQLREVCAEIVIGGADTTFANLTFAMLYMTLFPEVQKKIQEELDRIVGKDRLPTLEDRSRLTYTEATVQEILRLSSVAALCVPHTPLTTELAVRFRGYNIPKGTRVHFNFYDLHYDPDHWYTPEKMIPERFLDKNGRLIKRKPMFPFSGGQRTCPGEALARNIIYLMLTAILQRYTLRVPDGKPTPTVNPCPSIVLCPQRFDTKLQLRV